MKFNYMIILGIIGFLFSLFYGFYAIIIFSDPEEAKTKPFVWKLHQFWLNFIGSAVGWISLIALCPGIINATENNLAYYISTGDVLLFLLTFAGITGYLPFAVITILTGLSLIISKIPAFLKLDK